MSLLRRDVLKFGAGAVLASLLPTIGDPSLVRLATAMEVERLRPVVAPQSMVYWRLQLLRPGLSEPILSFAGHPQGHLVWSVPAGEGVAFISDTRRYELTEVSILPQVRAL